MLLKSWLISVKVIVFFPYPFYIFRSRALCEFRSSRMNPAS